MKYAALCIVVVAVLLSTTFLHTGESSYLRFGRSVTKRKLRDRPRFQVEKHESQTLNNQAETGTGLLDNAYLQRYNNW